MKLPTDPTEQQQMLYDVLKADEARRASRRIELLERVAQIPLSDELTEEIAWLGAHDQRTVLRSHPGYDADRKLKSLKSTLSIFQQAYEDLVAQLERFHAFSQTQEMGTRRGRKQLDQIQTAVNKELAAFSTASTSLVAHARRLHKSVPVPEWEAKLATIFDAQEHRFVTELRNLITHVQFPDISWQVKYGEERSSDFVLFSEDLLNHQVIHADARAFVVRCGDRVHVRHVADSYVGKVQRFYTWHADALEKNVPVALADYRRVYKTCRAKSARSIYRLFIVQFLAAQVDPYKHLGKVLLPTEVEAALKLPLRSKEQVDFIISAADEHEACDDELRQLVYRLFGVREGGGRR